MPGDDSERPHREEVPEVGENTAAAAAEIDLPPERRNGSWWRTNDGAREEQEERGKAVRHAAAGNRGFVLGDDDSACFSAPVLHGRKRV